MMTGKQELIAQMEKTEKIRKALEHLEETFVTLDETHPMPAGGANRKAARRCPVR